MNTFVKNKLDLTQNADKDFENWKRQFSNFANNANLNEDTVSWDNKLAAIEVSVTAETYDKIMSIHDQLPADDQQKLNLLLNKIGGMAGCVTNVWIHRKNFELCVQKVGQSFRKYCTDVVAAANKCEFTNASAMIVTKRNVMKGSSTELYLALTTQLQGKSCLKKNI